MGVPGPTRVSRSFVSCVSTLESPPPCPLPAGRGRRKTLWGLRPQYPAGQHRRIPHSDELGRHARSFVVVLLRTRRPDLVFSIDGLWLRDRGAVLLALG